MENRNEQHEENILTDQQMDKVVSTLLAIEEMDDRQLYLKIRRTIAARRAARRKKRIWAGSCAAFIALALIATVAILPGERESPGLTEQEPGVRLIVSDGRNYNLTGSEPPAELFSDGNAVMKAEENTLFVQSAAEEAAEVEPTYNTLEVPRGMQYDLVLSDGTKVWLNSDTRLRFPTTFPKSERRVYIEGEAYFEVARNEDKPFVVDIGSQSVTVLGTAFNVNAYEYNPSILTTLFSGSVKVNGGQVEQLLTPGQQASLDKATGAIQIREVDLSDALAWRVNIIHLEKRTLGEIISYMSKIYDVEFRFVDESARNIRFRGNVTRSDDVFSVLDRIGEVGNVRFNYNGNEIEVYMK